MSALGDCWNYAVARGAIVPRALMALGACAAIVTLTPFGMIVASFACAILLVSSCVVSRERLHKTFSFCFALLIPLVPSLGSEIITTVGLVFFLIAYPFTPRESPAFLWAGPFMAYVLGGIIGEISIASGVPESLGRSYLSGVTIDGAPRVLDVWRALTEIHAHSALWSARAALFLLAVSWFSHAKTQRALFLRGLLFGLPVSAAYAVAAWIGWVPAHFNRHADFWSSLHRVGGLLSDPNSLGLVMGLGLWCVAWSLLEFPRPKTLGPLWICIALASVAGFVSGSRTFLISLGLLLASLTWCYFRKVFAALVGMAVCVVVVVSIVDVRTDYLETIRENTTIPEGLKRGILALSLPRLPETVSSRRLFLELAQKVVEGHHLFGIGVDRFSDYVPLVGVRSGIVRGWTDNANNLYAGLFVELGLVGFVLFVCALAMRKRKSGELEGFHLATLVSLALLMITGPHTDFPEVLIIVSFLLGSVTDVRAINQYAMRSLCAVAMIIGMYGAYTREQGIMEWHEDGRGVTRWLSNRARIEMECQADPLSGATSEQVTIHAMYIPQREPLQVLVARDFATPIQLSLTTHEDQDVKFDCQRPGERSFVTLITTPPWSPYRAWPQTSIDRRLLGVQQVVRTP